VGPEATLLSLCARQYAYAKETPVLRLPNVGARGLVGPLVAVALIGGLTAAAQAAESKPEPRIVSAPKELRYDGSGRIVGVLTNGSKGDAVSLQRFENGGWSTVKVGIVSERRFVDFKVRDLHRNTSYRLSFAEDGRAASSKSVRVQVAPRLSLKPSDRDVYVGKRVRLKGMILPAITGRKVKLQRRVNGHWDTFRTLEAGDGTYSTKMSNNRYGRRKVRVRFDGDRFNAGARRRAAVNVYDPDPATWYGPGFYGHQTACGKTLGYETQGVAHRTLPCGTKVGILFKGRTVMVEVIDRGPYSHADWDLTGATARKLGFDGSQTIGVRTR
jgi:hypothetical protein